MSGFGILHYKLKLETKPALSNAFISSPASPITSNNNHLASVYPHSNISSIPTNKPNKERNTRKSNKTIARHNSDASSDQVQAKNLRKHSEFSKTEFSKSEFNKSEFNKSEFNKSEFNNKSVRTRDGRNRTRSTKEETRARPKRPQSWHSSNSSIDNNLNEKSDKTDSNLDSKFQEKYPASFSSSSKKEKKSISDGQDYKNRRSHIVKQSRARDFEKKAKAVAEKTGTTMSWSEFLADSKNSPVTIDNVKPVGGHKSGHFTVTKQISNPEHKSLGGNSESGDGGRQQPKRAITRKLSILDRLRQKVS